MEPQPPKNSAADPAANAAENPGEFPLTSWTMVARAGKDHAQDMQQALDQLLKRYIPALHAHLLLLTSLANFSRRRIPPPQIRRRRPRRWAIVNNNFVGNGGNDNLAGGRWE